MSAREYFFRKVQKNQENRKLQTKKINDDLKRFSFGMKELAEQIKVWLADSGIEITIGEKNIIDLSLDIIKSENPYIEQIYSITEVRLMNVTKTAMLIPQGLYLTENGSSAQLIINNNLGSSIQKKFLLILDNDARAWTIRPDGEPGVKAERLNEDTFFQAIESLA